MEKLYYEIIRILEKAGQILLDLQGKCTVSLKEDKSPVTQADISSQSFIVESLNKLFPGIPIISEEGEKQNKLPNQFFLLDPLDGTKSYIRNENNFTINLAFISNYKVISSFIHIPPYQVTYVYLRKLNTTFAVWKSKEKVINFKRLKKNTIVFASKDHLDNITEAFISHLKEKIQGEIEIIRLGSAIKFCALVNNFGDIYPRLSSHAKIWDMLPGMTILKGMGGHILTTSSPPFDNQGNIYPFVALSPNITQNLLRLITDIVSTLLPRVVAWEN